MRAVDLLEKAIDFARVADVGLERMGLAAAAVDRFGDRSSSPLACRLVHQDRSPRSGEVTGNGRTNAPRPTGYQGDLTRQHKRISHEKPPSFIGPEHYFPDQLDLTIGGRGTPVRAGCLRPQRHPPAEFHPVRLHHLAPQREKSALRLAATFDQSRFD
jgi:hypothetical protein